MLLRAHRREKSMGVSMKILGNIVGIVLVLMGAVWILQGANVLGGSFMSGQSQWLVIGIIVGIVGLGLLYWINRARPPV
jgi:protein-S-isoprenylcysteine O-methyltransferase Ste14